jgi:hypothetical protein
MGERYLPLRVLKPAAAYFALVFGTGFVLGTLRVLWVVPRVGARIAELSESPLMLLATVLAARWVNRHFGDGDRPTSRLGIGLIALALLLAAEIALGVALRGVSVLEALMNRDPVSGTVYYALLGVFAVMPWLLAEGREQARRARSRLTRSPRWG